MKKEKKKKNVLLRLFIYLVLIVVCILVLGRFYYTQGVVVKESAIYNKKLSRDYNGFKIVHFSDIHYGRTTDLDELKKVVEKINQCKPDIVVFTGDLFDNKKIDEKNSKNVTKALKKIEARLYKLAVVGDYDKKYLSNYEEIMQKSGFLLLDNTSKLVYYNSSTPINFIGAYDGFSDELFNNEYFNITIMHKPDLVNELDNTEIVLAGHSLGGQIKLPWLGGIRKIEGATNYINDYYKVNGKDLYISSGIGTQDNNFRLFNKPSINLYRLYNK